MPAVIAPSPITATTRRWSSRWASAIAIPSAAEIEVELWPTPKVSYALSARFGNGATPPLSLTVRSEERRVGKSVSVRVDLGGRGILNKKINTYKMIHQREREKRRI